MHTPITMRSVGDFLKKSSSERSDDEKDAFARSAYNRYYYAAFLAVRPLILEQKGDTFEVKHKQIPEILKGEITREIKRYKKDIQRFGYSKETSREISLCDASIKFAKSLAELMEIAYQVRVTADYNPEKKVSIQQKLGNTEFFLDNVSSTIASEWENTASGHVKNIISIIRKLK